jgi:glycosyltransferase involved in cell wall biosynthesis
MRRKTFLIPFHFSWGWSADYLRQTATELSRSGNVFCYLGVEQIRLRTAILRLGEIIHYESPTLCLYRPIQIIPFERFIMVRRLNEFINMLVFQLVIFCGRGFEYVRSDRIVWISNHMYYYFPDYVLGKHSILYDCVDVPADTNMPNVIPAMHEEELLIQKATNMTVISNTLYKAHRYKHAGIQIVPQGFRLAQFKPYGSLKKGPHSGIPIVGFVGTIDNRLDFKLLYALIKGNPQWKFELWGDTYITDESKLKLFRLIQQLKNVRIGYTSAEHIAKKIARFSIAVIPYDTSYVYNTYSYPMKLFEYFYMGKPVVASSIYELKKFPRYVKIAPSIAAWEKHIRSILASPWPETYQKAQRKLAEENSWHRKIDRVLQCISN